MLAGFFVLLFVGFYFALGQIVPGFGKPVLPVLSYVPSFSFQDQEGLVLSIRRHSDQQQGCKYTV